jgi:hypothetical protein
MATAAEKGIRIEQDDQGVHQVVSVKKDDKNALIMGSFGATVANLFKPRAVKIIPDESRARVVGVSEDGFLLLLLQNRTIMAVDAEEDSYFE